MAGQTYEEGLIYADKLEDKGQDTRLLRAWLTTIERRPPLTRMLDLWPYPGERQDGFGEYGDSYGDGEGDGTVTGDGGHSEWWGDGEGGYADGGGRD